MFPKEMVPLCLIENPQCLHHLAAVAHPEAPQRYLAIDQLLQERGLKSKALCLQAREATLDELLLCQTPSYLKLVEEEQQRIDDNPSLSPAYLSTGDVLLTPSSRQAALHAVGGALMGVDLLMEGKTRSVFSYLRPPGHHASSTRGMGFCLYNQAAIAARYAQKRFGVKRVLIADWDLHHGNGTQELFFEDPSVFYFSTHQWGIYPGTGSREEVGEGPGRGTTLNFPITPSATARHEVITHFDRDLKEAMRSFQPELVIISAGFDAHREDPLGALNLTEEDFARLTHHVKQIAEQYSQGAILSLLEGGYHPHYLALSVLAHLQVLAPTLF